MARIVVVDPDTLAASLVIGQLERAGHDVAYCATPEDAVTACSAAPTDCLVTELLLPGFNGIALLQSMQSYPMLAAIKAIVLTTVPRADVGLSQRAWREYGVAEYISKLDTRTAAVAQRIIRNVS